VTIVRQRPAEWATQGTAAPPARYAKGDQYDQIASGFVAFASVLLEERELMPIRPRDLVITCHVDDLKTLTAFAGTLGMETPVCTGQQWRSRMQFGPALSYILWTEAAK
jgi:hypothetical protein